MKKLMRLAGITTILFSLLAFHGCSSDDTGGGTETPKKSSVQTENKVNFKASDIGMTSATVTWEKSSIKDILYYVVEAGNKNSKNIYTSDKLSYKATNLKCNADNDIILHGYSYNSGNKDEELLKVKITVKTLAKGPLSSLNGFFSKSKGIELSWDEIPSNSDIKSIKIYSSSSENGEYTLLTELSASEKTYCISIFEFDTTYWYKAETFDSEGKSCGQTQSISVSTGSMDAPESVTDLKSEEYFDGWQVSWNQQVTADSYKIEVLSSEYSTTPLKTYETKENSCFIPRDIQKYTDWYVRVRAVNSKGEGSFSNPKNLYSLSTSFSCTGSVSDATSTGAKVTLEAKSGSKTISLKNAKAQYALLNSSTKTDFYKNYQDSNEFEINDLEFATSKNLYGIIKITYKSLDGSEDSLEAVSSKISVSTKGLPAPSKAPTVKSTSRSSAVIEFTPLTTEQLHGISATSIIYRINAYKYGTETSYESKDTTAGSTEPVTITLSQGYQYRFSVLAYVNGSTPNGEESEKSEYVALKAPLSKPEIKTIEEVTGETAPFSKIKVTFDKITEDTNEEIEYGLAWDVFKNSYRYNSESAKSSKDVTEIAEKVNGGNRYFVWLYAYESTEGKSTKVMSEPKEITLKKIPETKLTNRFNGTLPDITNSSTWKEGFTPKSTNTTYSWGLCQLEAGKANFYKFSLTDEMLNESSLTKLYYVESYYDSPKSKIGSTELAYGTKTYFMAPNDNVEEIGLTAIKEFADYSSSDSKYYNDPWKMPSYDNTGNLNYKTLDAPDKKGVYLSNLTNYIFNNALYILITTSDSTTANQAVGVSYK